MKLSRHMDAGLVSKPNLFDRAIGGSFLSTLEGFFRSNLESYPTEGRIWLLHMLYHPSELDIIRDKALSYLINDQKLIPPGVKFYDNDWIATRETDT